MAIDIHSLLVPVEVAGAEVEEVEVVAARFGDNSVVVPV